MRGGAHVLGRMLAPALTLMVALAGSAAATPLAIGLANPPSGLDPHAYVGSTDSTVMMNMFDALTRRAGDNTLEPALAERWEAEGEHAWTFTLRRGVRFHDGSDFTADDVAYTFARVLGLSGSLAGLASKLHSLASVEVMGPHAIRLHLSRPAPTLPADLSAVMIVSRGLGEAGLRATPDAGTVPSGTGAFRHVAFEPGSRVTLARNDGWWDRRPEWTSVSLRVIPRDPVRVAALLAGDIDMMERVAPADIAGLARQPAVALFTRESTSMVFVRPDFSRSEGSPQITDPAGRATAANPLRDLRVRRALSLAINRAALVDQLLDGLAKPAGQFVPPGIDGHDPALPLPGFAPDASRALLAEAGYPDGLRLVLHGPTDRVYGAPQVSEAVAQMWSRAGMPTTVATMPFLAMARRVARQEFALGIYNCCGSTSDAGGGLFAMLATYSPERRSGASNYGRYSNPVLDALLDRSLTTYDPVARTALQQQAIRVAAEDLAVIPLYFQLNAWATRRPIVFTPRIDGRTPAYAARRAP